MLLEKIRLLTGVRYLYPESTHPEGKTTERLPVPTKEMLAVLPAELKKQIYKAAVCSAMTICLS